MKYKMLCLTTTNGEQSRRVRIRADMIASYAEMNEGTIIFLSNHLPNPQEDMVGIAVKQTVDQIDQMLFVDDWEYVMPEEEEEASTSDEEKPDFVSEENWKDFQRMKKELGNDTLSVADFHEIAVLLSRLTETPEERLRFYREPRPEWAGLTPAAMILTGKAQAVINLLRRMDEGDPVS